MNISINRIIKFLLVSYIIFMSLFLVAYMSCFFIDKFSNDMITSITKLDDGYFIELANKKLDDRYFIKLTNFEFKFPVLFSYLDLISGGFVFSQILIITSAFIYLRFMNGKYTPSIAMEKLHFIEKLILVAYVLSNISITTNKWGFSLTENLWLLLVLFLLQKDILIVKNTYEKSWEVTIENETINR